MKNIKGRKNDKRDDDNNKNEERCNNVDDSGSEWCGKSRDKNNVKKRTATVTPQIFTSKTTSSSAPTTSSLDPRLASKRQRENYDEEDERRMKTTTSTTITTPTIMKKKKKKREELDRDDENDINENNDDLSMNVKDNVKKFAYLVKFIGDSTKNKIRNKQQTDLVNGTNNNVDSSIFDDASSAAAAATINSGNGGVKKKSTLTLNARPRNFHEFALVLYTLSKLPKQSKDSLKRNIRTIFEDDEIKICVGAFKRKTARELFQFLTYQIGNPQNLKNQVKKMYVNYNMQVDDGLFTDKYMISIPDLWYPFTDDRHCYWNGFETLNDTLNSWEGYNLDGNVCERCMTFFITANKHGACPELYRTELTEIKRRQTIDVRSAESSSDALDSAVLISKCFNECDKLEDRNEDSTKTTVTAAAAAISEEENTNFDIEDLFSMRDNSFTSVDIPSDLIECILNGETTEEEKVSVVVDDNNASKSVNLILDDRSNSENSENRSSATLSPDTTRSSRDKRKIDLNTVDRKIEEKENNNNNNNDKERNSDGMDEQRRRQKASKQDHQHQQRSTNDHSTKKKRKISSSRDTSIEKHSKTVRDVVSSSRSSSSSDTRHSKNFDV